MEQKEIIKKIKALVQLDIDATQAYKQAIEKVEQREVRERLSSFRGDHERHVRELSAKLRSMGEQPPDSPDLKGYLLEGFTSMRSAGGTQGALKAMQSNEKLTNRKYEEARKLEVPADLRTMLENFYQDEVRHLSYIEQAISSQIWERREERAGAMGAESEVRRPVPQEVYPPGSATVSASEAARGAGSGAHEQLFDLIRKDHQEVKKIFTRIKETEGPAERRNLVESLRKEILPHMIGEEKAIYVALRKRDEAWSDAMEAIEEHHAAQLVLRELFELSPRDEHFRAKVSVLKEMVEHHIREEESKIFKDLREVLDESESRSVLEGFQREKEIAQSEYPNIPAVTSERPEIRVH